MDANLQRILDTPARDLQRHELRIIEAALDRVSLYGTSSKTIGEILNPVPVNGTTEPAE